MKTTEKTFSEIIVSNIIKLMRDRDLKQSTLAERMNTTQSQISKKLSGELRISLNDLAEIASALSKMATQSGKPSVSVVDIITYPDKYAKVENGDAQSEPIEAVLQIKLQKSKKDQVLKLIFGDNDIEILNH